jgi:6-pyruvoyltetrahydropterin/6-carboxytetrahydropterin synthase
MKGYRKENFNAAHRLHNPAWDDAANKKVFGLCNNPNYHGHNYTVIVKLTGEIDPVTGFVIDAKIIKNVILQEVIEPFDHNNLNLDVPDFEKLNPTAENIAAVIWHRLRKRFDNSLALSVKLYETEKNYVKFNGQE